MHNVPALGCSECGAGVAYRGLRDTRRCQLQRCVLCSVTLSTAWDNDHESRSALKFCNTSITDSCGSGQIKSAFLARRSKNFTWSANITPDTDRSSGRSTSKGYPYLTTCHRSSVIRVHADVWRPTTGQSAIRSVSKCRGPGASSPRGSRNTHFPASPRAHSPQRASGTTERPPPG